MIQTEFYTVERRDDAVLNTFPDGTISTNTVPRDDGTFALYGRQCGFIDPEMFNLAHEAAHAICAEVFFGRPSYVVSTAARGKMMSWVGAGYEERVIAYIQRAAVGVLPVIDPLWQVVIDRLAVLGLVGDPAVAATA